MELRLVRMHSCMNDVCTIGELFIDDSPNRECYILEDVVREVADVPVAEWKVQDKTAIPRGRYQIVFNFSNHFNTIMPELLAVPGFKGVRIHSGNDADDTEGCLITGNAICNNNEAVSGSKCARDKLYAKLHAATTNGEEVWITVS